MHNKEGSLRTRTHGGSARAGAFVKGPAAFAIVLLVGAVFLLLFRKNLPFIGYELSLVAATLVALLIPQVRQTANSLWIRMEEDTSAIRFRRAILLGAFVSVALLAVSFLSGRTLTLRFGDEYSYFLQARMFSQGVLALPAHPMADFFETFYVQVKPVYASMYFPGTALLYLPSGWGLFPFWALPLLAAGTTAGLLYLVLSEFLNGAWGAVGVYLLVSTPMFRFTAPMFLSHIPTLLLGLCVVWGWLKWRRTPTGFWAVWTGAASGWLLVTRPVDALAFLLPTGVGLAADLLRQPGKQRCRSICLVMGSALPFLGFQAVYNRAVTGSTLQFPWSVMAKDTQPGISFGGGVPKVRALPENTLPIKRALYQEFILPLAEKCGWQRGPAAWAATRFGRALQASLAVGVLFPFWLAGWLGLREKTAWTVAAVFPCFVALYAFYPLFLTQYAVPLALSTILLVLAGARKTGQLWPQARPAVLVFLALLPLAGWPGINPALDETVFAPQQLHRIDRALAELPRLPAVVLFRFAPPAPFHEEAVYNLEQIRPDECRIIRAQDLGERNREIFRYYGRTQPERYFYRYDRATDSLVPLGYARDLAREKTRPEEAR